MDTEYLKKVGLYILTALLSLGAVFYFGYHIWHSVTKEVKTVPVTEFTADNTVSCDAYIFRSEIPLHITGSGRSAVPCARDGERVQIGSEVAKVYSESSPRTVAEISDVESRIKLLESGGMNGTVSLKESSRIEAEIYSTLAEIREASAVGDIRTAQDLRAVLLTLMNKRSLLSGGGAADFRAEIGQLEAKKQELSASLGSYLESITASSGGYYYSVTDGYETVFKAEDIEEMSYESMKKVLSSSPVKEDNRAGKIVTDSYWYAVCPLDKKYLETFRLEKDYTVKFAGDFNITMEVYKILSGEDGIAVILKTNYLPDSFTFTRMQSAELVTGTSSGLKVPVAAVRVVSGKVGVYVLDEATVKFARIDTIVKNDSYYVVSPKAPEEADEEPAETDENGEEIAERWLRFHDNLIVEGKGLYDGRIIG